MLTFYYHFHSAISWGCVFSISFTFFTCEIYIFDSIEYRHFITFFDILCRSEDRVLLLTCVWPLFFSLFSRVCGGGSYIVNIKLYILHPCLCACVGVCFAAIFVAIWLSTLSFFVFVSCTLVIWPSFHSNRSHAEAILQQFPIYDDVKKWDRFVWCALRE